MRYQGTITKWKDDQGFGFITPDSGGRQVFVHIKSFVNRRKRPMENEIVTYKVKSDDKGKTRAENVRFFGEKSSSGYSNIPILVIVAFFAFLMYAVVIGKIPIHLLGIYLIVSIIAFLAYLLDKSAAKNDQWRTKESTLHFFALIGGWPGALTAQRFLRHKSKKKSFKIMFWITVLINWSILGWLFTSDGAIFMYNILISI